MSKRGAIHRYYLIVEKVLRGGLPSFAAIKRYLEADGFELDDRTLRGDEAGVPVRREAGS